MKKVIKSSLTTIIFFLSVFNCSYALSDTTYRIGNKIRIAIRTVQDFDTAISIRQASEKFYKEHTNGGSTDAIGFIDPRQTHELRYINKSSEYKSILIAGFTITATMEKEKVEINIVENKTKLKHHITLTKGQRAAIQNLNKDFFWDLKIHCLDNNPEYFLAMESRKAQSDIHNKTSTNIDFGKRGRTR